MGKIFYLKLLQIVLTLAFIWQLRSLRELCGTFADPKAFLHDISVGHCKNFTLIGKDSKSGKFSAFFDEHKWHDQLSMSSTTNDGPIEEQQHHQFMDELAAQMPPAGRHCIPITIPFFGWIGKNRKPLNNGTLSDFSFLMMNSLLTLVALLWQGITKMRRSVVEYERLAFVNSFIYAFFWCFYAVLSFKLLFNWTDFWTCVNFQADHANVPLVILLFSIGLVCLYVKEFFLRKSAWRHRINLQLRRNW